MKIKKIRIKPLNQMLDEFANTYKRAAAGKLVKKTQGTFFASIDAVRKVLTENRMQLMRVIKEKKPASLYELAKFSRRDLKNVSQDIAFLEDLGLVDLEKPHGSRKQRRPVLLSDRFSVEFSI